MKNNTSFEQLQEMLQLSLSCGMPAAAKLDLIRATMHSLIQFAESKGADFSPDTDGEAEMVEFFSTITGARTAEKFARLIGVIVANHSDEDDEEEETPLRTPKGFDLSRN
jgi:hypothetical protein